MTHEPPTFRTFISAFTDFLTVATHAILYERNIYPKTSFITARKYNFPVRQSRHPRVCEWITDAISAVGLELLKGTVERVAVVIVSKTNRPLERYVFEVSRFPTVQHNDLDVPLERLAADGSKAAILPHVDLEEQLRATMSRLASGASSLASLPKGCTFTIAIELKGEGNAPVSHPQPWVPAERQSSQDDSQQGVENHTTPVRAVRAGGMLFETWIEQVKDAPTEQTSAQSSAG